MLLRSLTKHVKEQNWFAVGMYRNAFEGQLAQHKAHRESFAKLTEMLVEEKNK